jgi:hypothetical protein
MPPAAPRAVTDEADGFGRAVQPVHASILPLHRDGAGVADRPQRAERVFPWPIPVPGGDEVPPAIPIASGQVRTQNSLASAGRAQPGVRAVDVIDALGELRDESHRIYALPHHVARVPVESEVRPILQGLERVHALPIVISDLRGVPLLGEPVNPTTVNKVTGWVGAVMRSCGLREPWSNAELHGHSPGVRGWIVQQACHRSEGLIRVERGRPE